MTIKLEDHSIRHPVAILKDISFYLGKLVILCEFIVMDMDDNFELPPPLVLGAAIPSYYRGGD